MSGEGGLRDRIALVHGRGPTKAPAAGDDSATADSAKLLDEVARALKSASDRVARLDTRPEPRAIRLVSEDIGAGSVEGVETGVETGAGSVTEASAADPSTRAVIDSIIEETDKRRAATANLASGMPQILQSRVGPFEPSQVGILSQLGLTLRLSEGALLAPAVLGLSLLLVVVLLSVSGTDLARITGPSAVTQPATVPAGTSGITASSAAGLVSQTAAPAMPKAPLASAAELVLFARVETMIARGDIQEARQELVGAATRGSTNATFALAETFDPNMLAAWGRREPVGDVVVARSLYGQAGAGGDPRAQYRIDALRQDDE